MQYHSRAARRTTGWLVLYALISLIGCTSPMEPGPTRLPDVTAKVPLQRKTQLQRCQQPPDIELERISVARCRIPDVVIQ